MNMSNIILIMLAILLLWGAINLDRTSQRRVVEDKVLNLMTLLRFFESLTVSLLVKRAIP